VDFTTCPLPILDYPAILLAHGGGGRLMRQLIEQIFLPLFGSPDAVLHDAAALRVEGDRIALTTDSYVVSPLFFPGGDIGSLAVYGTVNDLAMAGARPLYLSASFILEEGLPVETLWRVACSMQRAAAAAGVRIVTGDTKVVDRGKGDGMFITTAGVGAIARGVEVNPRSIQPGDVILLNGDLGRHGIAILAAREGLEFEGAIASDAAPVAAAVQALLEAGVDLHCARDLTRGGLATALNELAAAAALGIAIEEDAIPVRAITQGVCEVLGLDPLYVANEGRFVAFVPPADSERALAILRQFAPEAAAIGRVAIDPNCLVVLESTIGSTRIVDLPSGEQLPRIC